MAMRYYGFLNEMMSGAGALVSADGDRVPVMDVPQGGEIVLFAPGADISLLSAVLPARSEAEIIRAAPYAVEDDLAVPVEDLHFVVGPASADKQAPRAIHAVAREKMQSWSDWVQTEPALARCQVVAEQSLIAPEHIYEVDGQFIGNVAGRAFVLDMDLPDDMRQPILQGRQVDAVSRDAFLKILARTADNARTLINLRQGQYRAGSATDVSGLRQWRLSAGLAAALGFVLCAGTMLETSSLRKAQSKVETSIAASFKAVFPDAPTPNNYVRAVSRAVSGQNSGGGIGFREASAALYTALEGVPDARLLSLQYSQIDGELVAKISYSVYGNDAALKAALSEQGLVANLGDVRQERTGVVGDIIIRRGTS